jgi:hypothetical protein
MVWSSYHAPHCDLYALHDVFHLALWQEDGSEVGWAVRQALFSKRVRQQALVRIEREGMTWRELRNERSLGTRLL